MSIEGGLFHVDDPNPRISDSSLGFGTPTTSILVYVEATPRGVLQLIVHMKHGRDHFDLTHPLKTNARCPTWNRYIHHTDPILVAQYDDTSRVYCAGPIAAPCAKRVLKNQFGVNTCW